MNRSAHQKGTDLENAVAAIEEAILGASPNLKEKSLQIESRKIINQGGTRHEIDLYVSVDLGNGYRSVFIFECKNWESSVGKNEVIVFSAKTDATSAQHGFFVAKSLTSDATALIDSNPRLTFVPVLEHDASQTPVPFAFHAVIREETKASIEFAQVGQKRGKRIPVALTSSNAEIDGQKIDLKEHVENWIEEECGENLRSFNSTELADGVYDREFSSVRHFTDFELQIGGHNIDRCEFDVQYKVRVVHPPIVAHYELEKRGRSITFAPVAVGDGEFSVRMTFPEEPQS